ncbi:hypothetical protein [Thiothrix winogradskyi]|uniref:Uncharacterized protein n=1 Tax=Thiothrix winogradskyi TaxID=96472 RepID=A0ABY3T512_9GAMM|nr:hypothetical protein [Thiothrix winogradskyi]UJS26689.1 hypothetical protein L2Y54_21595 [Thiothrix winogradskyi]
MTEEQHGYGTVEAQLKRLETHLQTISTDPAASDWLKRAVVELWERDVLRDLLEEKHRIDRLLLEKWAKNHDGTRH